VSKKNLVFREILYRVLEKDEWTMTQKSISETCNVSLDTVHKVVWTLSNFRAVEKKPLGFRVTNVFKVLQYWACTRNLHNDIVFTTYVPEPPSRIEEDMPEGAIFTGFSGYYHRFPDKTKDYSEVVVYADADLVGQRFKKKNVTRPNIIVLKTDAHLRKVSEENVAPLAQIYADLWQLGSSQSERLLVEFDSRLRMKPIEKFKKMIGVWRGK